MHCSTSASVSVGCLPVARGSWWGMCWLGEVLSASSSWAHTHGVSVVVGVSSWLPGLVLCRSARMLSASSNWARTCAGKLALVMGRARGGGGESSRGSSWQCSVGASCFPTIGGATGKVPHGWSAAMSIPVVPLFLRGVQQIRQSGGGLISVACRVKVFWGGGCCGS